MTGFEFLRNLKTELRENRTIRKLNCEKMRLARGLLRADVLGILKNSRGELLIESLAGFSLFSILMLAVSTIIVTSFKITELSIKETNERQVGYNLDALEKSVVAPEVFTISGGGIDDVNVEVELSIRGDIKAFYPKVEP